MFIYGLYLVWVLYFQITRRWSKSFQDLCLGKYYGIRQRSPECFSCCDSPWYLVWLLPVCTCMYTYMHIYSHEHIHVPCTELYSPVGTGRHNMSFSNICAHSPDMNVHTWFIQLVCSIDYLTPENRTVADKYNLSVILTLRWTPPGQRQGMGHPVIAPVLLPISKLHRYVIRLQP